MSTNNTIVSKLTVIRDASIRQVLNGDERANVPTCPAGLIELKDAELDAVSGGVTDGCIPRPGKPVLAW